MGRHRVDFVEVCKKFNQAILVTHDVAGELQSCPVLVACLDIDGDLWFAAHRGLLKSEDVKPHTDACVTMVSDGAFASINGEIEEHRDQSLASQFWNESWRDWFADGPSDAALSFIRLRAQFGEYWSLGNATRLKHFFPVRETIALPSDDLATRQTHLKMFAAK